MIEFCRQMAVALSDWGPSDTWTVITGALAAMACALPGCFLLLRRQSMLGDALSHTALLGVVTAFWVTHALLERGWILPDQYDTTLNVAMFAGAIIVGVLTALLTEAVQRHGQVESNAALGVVFTLMFAAGLLLIRLVADQAHIDPDCVLYGNIETSVWDTWPGTSIPRAVLTNGFVLLLNAVLLVAFFKELKLATFDPGLAVALGIRPDWIHYALMAVTALTLIAAFESVGSILVIGMLIVPAACAFLCTQRLRSMIVVALGMASLSAALGHALAFTLPQVVFRQLGFPEVRDASTAGMMAFASGLLFIGCMLFAPRQGLLMQAWVRTRVSQRVIQEDILGWLFRSAEADQTVSTGDSNAHPEHLRKALSLSRLRFAVARKALASRGWVEMPENQLRLTAAGYAHAASLVRSHRLWESYLSQHFGDEDRILHESAERAEHYIDADLRERIERELTQPDVDPHGQAIPPESPTEPP